MNRYATTNAPLASVEPYLPGNYSAMAMADGSTLISGEDSCGWTLDGYVIPRLGSGLIFAREVPASDLTQDNARLA